MSDEIRRVVIEVLAETRQAEQALGRTKTSMTELNQGAELAQKGFAVLSTSVKALMSVIDRGQAVSELSAAFGNLQTKAGNLASGEMATLRTATQGLISDTDLMRASNQALLSGMKPEQFRQLAEAADALGDAVGVGTKQALDDLTAALTTGMTRGLEKNYGLVVDNTKALDDFAKSIGTEADKLNEVGKAEAIRLAVLDALAKKQKEGGEAAETAGDKIQQLGVIFDNSVSGVTKMINESGVLVFVLGQVEEWAKKAAIAIEVYAGTSKQGQAAAVQLQLDSLKARGPFDPTGNGNPSAEWVEVYNAQVSDLTFKLNALTASAISHNNAEAAAAAANVTTVKTVEQLRKEYTDQNKLTGDAAKNSIELKKQQEKLNETIDAQVKKFSQLGEASNLDNLATGLQKAIDSVDATSFNNLSIKYEEALNSATRRSLEEQNREAIAAGRITAEELASQQAEIVGASMQDVTEEWQKAQAEAYQASVDFFADLLTPMFEGQAANFEDIFLDAAKRIAIGFASELAASWATSLGVGGVGNLGSAQGLGQLLASYITGSGGGGGGSSLLSNIIGGGSTAASTYSAFGGGGGAGAATSFGGNIAQGTGLAGGATPAYVYAAPIAGAALFYTAVKEFEKSNKDWTNATKAGAQTYLAGDVTGISQAYFAGVAAFGGSTDATRLARRNLRTSLEGTGLGEGLNFGTIGGNVSLYDSKYVEDKSNPQNAGAIGLANPLANIFTQGDDVLGPQLAAMFADATDNAANFNEVLINTQSLMGKMGIDAEQAKNDLASLYLDGKISLEQFSDGIVGLNILATDNLVGPNSIADALGILTNELATPRTKLKGLELAFKEMAEVGIDTSTEIHDYISANFPDLIDEFDALTSAGIDTFEEIQNASADQLVIIFNAIKNFVNNSNQVTGELNLADDIDDGTSAGVNSLGRLTGALRGVRIEAEKTKTALAGVGGSGTSAGSGANPNTQNNGRPA